ncbi:MAG: type V CRISPR-associated protein Cas4 [Eubacteriales bacterium]|nr:type V CRISPR-associated protein Cas4 [Eubacteriales bacterium]MDY3332745.1 type V CRISPR-associated protein Cas4 [Gallibacter sp.]
MDELILISYLNDYIFCPASIYFHNMYGNREQLTFQKEAQLNGKKAHETIDKYSYYDKRNIITGIDIYSERYGLVGKIDIYDSVNKILIERKKKVVEIYDGYILQLYAQYFSMQELGYTVESMYIHSLDDNKRYYIKKPLEDLEMFRLFEDVIVELKTTDISNYVQTNVKKCENCIYSDACDRGLV